MPSTYTQNLGIELPATGEQANTWGLTVNRNMDTLDTAINGNTSIAIGPSSPSAPYLLTLSDGADSPVAANPVIIWTGPQSTQGVVHIDWQADNKHLYIMSNQTTGGYGIAFAQGSGTQFVLQGGYDAIIYTDGGGTSANTAAALANPQFGNLLATGNAQVTGTLQVTGNATMSGTLQVTGAINGIITTDVQGNVHFTGGLGLGNPAAIPDPLTINGVGVGGQMRLVYGNYGVIFRNDGSQFYVMVTASGNPYGSWASIPIEIDLASKSVGIIWGPSASYGLSVPSIHTGSIVVDTTITAGGGITASGGIFNTSGRSYFTSGDNLTIGLEQGSGIVTYIGTNLSNQFQISNQYGTSMFVVDQSGNGLFAGALSASALSCGGVLTASGGVNAGGWIHATGSGIMFPDGTTQTTKAVTAANTLQFLLNGGSIGTGPVLNLTNIGGGIVLSSRGVGEYDIGFSSSDLRLKQNIETLTGGLSVIQALRPVRAEWNGLARTNKGQPLVSVIAQELQEVEPAAVYTYLGKLRPEDKETTELLGLELMALIGHLILAVQQLNKKLG